jgi:hypothetical protein
MHSICRIDKANKPKVQPQKRLLEGDAWKNEGIEKKHQGILPTNHVYSIQAQSTHMNYNIQHLQLPPPWSRSSLHHNSS